MMLMLALMGGFFTLLHKATTKTELIVLCAGMSFISAARGLRGLAAGRPAAVNLTVAGLFAALATLVISGDHTHISRDWLLRYTSLTLNVSLLVMSISLPLFGYPPFVAAYARSAKPPHSTPNSAKYFDQVIVETNRIWNVLLIAAATVGWFCTHGTIRATLSILLFGLGLMINRHFPRARIRQLRNKGELNV